MADLKLSQIWIYPIKSLGGINLTTAKVLGKGLKHDRRWMLVDQNGICMTQRIYPTMALFKVTLESQQLSVGFAQDKLSIPFNQQVIQDAQRVQIFDDTVSTMEVSADHSAWFSDHLRAKCRLVYFPEENSRPIDPEFAAKNEHVSLADAFPYLVIGQASLDDLNSRLSNPVPINRFRPNFVFTGGTPYEEDSWKGIKIGSTEFMGTRPCARCVLTTVDQTTAERGAEPLRTLSTYRKRDNKIFFGQNLMALGSGEVRVDDIITPKGS